MWLDYHRRALFALGVVSDSKWSMEEIELASWSDFSFGLQRIDEKRKDRQQQNNGRCLKPTLFRGLGNYVWSLETTLERFFKPESINEKPSVLRYYRKVTRSQPAVESLISAVWQDLPDYPAFQKLLQSDYCLDRPLGRERVIYEYLTYLRHHGYPSPLLDWTVSPWVASFFAFDRMATDATHVAIYALAQDTCHSISGDQHLFDIGPYVRTHPRHYLQQSRYTMCVSADPTNNEARRDYLFYSHDQALTSGPNRERDLLVKVKIPAKERRTALEQLDLMNINAYSLFGSEDSLIHTLATRQCLFEKWGLP